MNRLEDIRALQSAKRNRTIKKNWAGEAKENATKGRITREKTITKWLKNREEEKADCK